MKNFIFLKEAKKQNALTCIRAQIMPTRENQCACHDLSVSNIFNLSGQNSHLFSQNDFLQSIIYPTKKTIILAWGMRYTGEVTITVGRCAELELFSWTNTWYTLISKAVCRTQKTSFPLSSNSKASLCSNFKTNPSSWARKSRQSTSVILKRKLQESIHHARYVISRMTCWKHYLTACWQLAWKFSQCELPVAERSG